MSDRKISQLTPLTTPAAGDYLPIVDISEASAANKNKRITIEELLRGAPDGTAAAPSFAFESDPDSGLYSAGANAVAISTNGNGRLFIDSTGRVGIGTSSPAAQLQVETGNIAFGGTGLGFPYGAAQSVSVVPSEGLISFGTDGRDVAVTGQGGCYIWSGKGSAGQFPAGTLALQSRSSIGRPIVFITGSTPTERARIDSDGYFRLAGGGIQFNGDTAAANALDDYEEGTYSMSVTGTAGGSIVFTSPTLTYLKVGRLVFISGSIVVSSSTAAGSELIVSLPFSVPSTSSFGQKDCTFNDNSAGTRTVIYLRADSTSLFKLNFNAATPAVNDVFTFSFSYYAA